jgi:hypothetical protein
LTEKYVGNIGEMGYFFFRLSVDNTDLTDSCMIQEDKKIKKSSAKQKPGAIVR